MADHLRLLLAKIGEVTCHACGQPVRRDSPQSAAERLAELPADTGPLVWYLTATDQQGCLWSTPHQIADP